jgi:hypothetical protein
VAAVVDFHLRGDEYTPFNPSPEAREIAARLCDKAFDGHALTRASSNERCRSTKSNTPTTAMRPSSSTSR